jgi:hypothetical protein
MMTTALASDALFFSVSAACVSMVIPSLLLTCPLLILRNAIGRMLWYNCFCNALTAAPQGGEVDNNKPAYRMALPEIWRRGEKL